MLLLFFDWLVRDMGLEPTLLTEQEPKSCAAANYANPAYKLPQLSVSSVPHGLQLAPYCGGMRSRHPRGSQLNYMLAGMVGFEPTMLARQINSLLP